MFSVQINAGLKNIVTKLRLLVKYVELIFSGANQLQKIIRRNVVRKNVLGLQDGIELKEFVNIVGRNLI